MLAAMQVELGDHVEVEAEGGLLWVGEVLEMFQTTEVCLTVSLHPVTIAVMPAPACRGIPHHRKCDTFRRALHSCGAARKRWTHVVPTVMPQPEDSKHDAV